MNSDAAIEMHQAQEQLDGLPDHSQQPLPDPQYGDSNFYSSDAPDAATSDDPSIIPTPDLDDTPPFSIRGYVAAVRNINIAKCWPFSRKLLEESIREGKDPLLPPLSPCASVVHLSRHYFDPAGIAHEGVDEVCLTEGPQLQVQIDLSKCEPESEGQGGTLIVGMSASLEAGPLEREKPSAGNQLADVCPATSQEHKASSIKDVQLKPRTVTPFPENIFVFKRHAPRSIREIRESVMEGCQCFKRTECLGCMQIAGGFNGTLQMSMGNKMPILNSSIINVPAGPGDSRNKELAVHHNTSESNLLEDCRKERATINRLFVKKISHMGVDTIENIVSDFNLIEKVEDEIATMQASGKHKEFPMVESDVPLDLETEMQGNTVAVALPSKRASKLCEDTISKACILDTQSVDNSLENFKSESSNSMPCSDAITQQKCPVCLLFQSSSNTALNAHIDHCLASSDMERSKPKWQKAKVRKKRSIAELCSIAPPCVLDELHDLDQNILPPTTLKEDTPSKIGMKRRPKSLALGRRQSTQGSCHRRRICTSRSRGKAFKFQWSKLNRIASPGHPRQTTGALKMALHERRLHHVKRANSLGRTLNWNSKTMLRKSNSLKRKNDAPVSIADQEPEEMNQKSIEHFSNEVQGTPVNEKQKVPKLLRRRKGKANQNLDEEAVQDLTVFGQSELKKTFRKQLRKINVKDQKAMSRSKLLKEKLPRNVSKQAAHHIRSDNLITVPGSHDTTLETLEREANANDRHDQGTQLARKTQFRLHLKPAKNSKNKYQHNSAGSFDDSTNLQLAIIQYPSVPQRGLNEECMVEGVHSRETNLQVDAWLDYDSRRQQSEMDVRSLEQHIPVQPQLLSEQAMSNPSNVRILVEERSMQEPSLPTISSMFQGHFNEARGRNKVRDLEASLAECTAPSLLNRALPSSDNSLLAENLHCTNTPYRSLHDVPQFPIDAQSKEALFLRNHSSEFTRQAWHPVGEAHRRVQVVDPQQAQGSPLLSTALTDYNDILGQQHGGFSLSLCRKDTNQWPGHCQERSLSMASLEDLRPLVPVHLIKPLQITGLSKTSTASHMNRELTRADILTTPAGRHDKHLPAFHNAETHQLNQGSTPSVLPKDHPSIQNPSVQTGSSVETRQAEGFSRNLPPWMQAAIKDQRSVPFAPVEITGNPLNQSSVLGTSSLTNREMSGGSSVFDIVGKPVLRLMGKTMVLTPGADQNQVDIGITHLNGQSNSGYMNLLQPRGPREHSFEQLKQWNSSQQQQAGYQAGFTQNRVSGEPIIRNREDQSWLSPGSCSQPQLRDLFSSAASSQTAQYAFAKQHASFQLSGSFPTNVSGQEVFTHSSSSRGTPLYKSKFPDAYMSWQHQKLKGQSSFEPHSTVFCQCGYPASHGSLCEGRRCNGYESILPQGHANAGNPAYSLLDVPNSMLQGSIQVNAHAVPSWLSNVNRNDKVQKPAEIFIIDDEDDPIGSMPRLLGQELNLIPNFRPPMSAALHPLQHHNAGNIATVPGTCNPTRQNPKTKAFVPVIYTIGGKRAESRFIPSSVARPKFQELASEECREVENYGTVINPKKRIGYSEQSARIGKFVKTSERGSPANFSNRDGSPCDLVLRGWGEPGASAKQRPPVKALRPAVEQLQGEESRGKICTPEVFISGNLSTQPLDKDSTQCPTSLNSSKASRIVPLSMGLHGPLVGICSTNMNPAEVDCQDAGQFMSMPCLSSSKIVPPHNGDSGQECIYINSGLSPSRLQSTVTMQEPGPSSGLPPASLTITMQEPGPSGLPPASSTATMQEPGPSLGLTPASSMTHQFISMASDTFVLKSVRKGDNHLPVIYDSSKQYPWIPEKTGAKSSDLYAANQSSLVSEGTQGTAAMSSNTWLNSRTQPGLEGTTQSQGMKPFKGSGKFLIVNGRVSIVDMAKEKVAAVADRQYQEPRDHNRVPNDHQSLGTKIGNGSMTIRDSHADLTTAVPNWHAISESL